MRWKSVAAPVPIGRHGNTDRVQFDGSRVVNLTAFALSPEWRVRIGIGVAVVCRTLTLKRKEIEGSPICIDESCIDE
jgi:hypothetical protein